MNISDSGISPSWESEAIDNCGGMNCIHTPTIWENLLHILYPTLIYLGSAIIISFFITLGFYLLYKHKNDVHPLKHAIKRSWPRWVIIFLIPFILWRIIFLFI